MSREGLQLRCFVVLFQSESLPDLRLRCLSCFVSLFVSFFLFLFLLIYKARGRLFTHSSTGLIHVHDDLKPTQGDEKMEDYGNGKVQMCFQH